MKTIRVAIAIYAICLLPIGVSAQAPDSDASLIHNPVYQKNCEKCHGKAATGDTLLDRRSHRKKVTAASSDDLRNLISNGKGHMPKFAGKLTPEEIDQLVAQIKALAKQ